ncbi:response regulator [bacterium]|jgi:DNA-binding NtrC family response regulator|nr:response regulator [bacterium]
MSERNLRILIVDDEVDLVTFLAKRLLKRDYHVVTTTSGPEALAIATRESFDVAIVDLKMPHMDGVEVIEKLHNLQPFLEPIMFTGHGNTETALEAGKLDVFKYLTKPCDFEIILTAIEEAGAHRRTRLREQFQEKLQDIMEHASTPRDILEASNKLREEYEQD